MALNHKTRRHSDGPGGICGSSFAITPEFLYRQAIQVTLDQIPDTIEGKIIVCTSCKEGGENLPIVLKKMQKLVPFAVMK